jgi:hypothetical protein
MSVAEVVGQPANDIKVNFCLKSWLFPFREVLALSTQFLADFIDDGGNILGILEIHKKALAFPEEEV